jgi:membrane associated rhomboid family serine protease
MTDEPTEVRPPQAVPTCYRHPGVEAHVLCQRCGRNICANCMKQASVGFQCPECVKQGARTTRQARTPYGGLRPSSAGLVTMILIGINLLVFVLVVATGGSNGSLLPRLALIPVGGIYLVNGQPTFVDGVANGAYWQLLTSMFTHVQIWHIGFNMLALYVLGPQLEALLGRVRFITLFLLSAGEHSPTIGASGALFGLMAALLVVALRAKGDVQSLMWLVAINVVITVLGAGYISWQGHLGGFVGGLVLGVILVYAPKRRRTLWQVLGCSMVAALIVIAVVARTAVLT